MNKAKVIYTVNYRDFNEKPDETGRWFCVQSWCFQKENFEHTDLVELTEEEDILTKGRFKNYSKNLTPSFGTKTINKIVTPENAEDLINWCGTNLKERWSIEVSETELSSPEEINSVFYFENHEDAAFFKLSWG